MKHEYKQALTQYYTTDTQYFENLDKHFYKHEKQYVSKLPRKAFEGKLVLEAGCGSGAMANWLEKNWAASVVGVDLSIYSLTLAHKRYTPHFAQSDLEQLPFKGNTFDTILLFDVLEHVVYPQAVFKEFHRVLKKGGYLVIISPNLIFNPRVPISTKILEILDTLKGSSEFRYVAPLVDGCACGDQEATLITNPVKVMRCLRDIGFVMVRKNRVRCNLIAKK